jgi:hypothetical protein
MEKENHGLTAQIFRELKFTRREKVKAGTQSNSMTKSARFAFFPN